MKRLMEMSNESTVWGVFVGFLAGIAVTAIVVL